MARQRGPSDGEFREEIEAHIALETERLISDGWRPDAAAVAARRSFGNVTRVRERFYESRRWMWFEDARHDARVAFRSLQRSPGFMAVALLTLAVGVGANTAIFGVVNAVLLRPLPYAEPGRLILIEHPPLGGSPTWLRDAWRARARALADFAGFEPSSAATLLAGNQPMQVDAAHVTANFFPLLGIAPAVGRSFSADDAREGATPVAMLTHGLWVRRFGGRPDVIGATITLTDVAVTGQSHVIVGVLPRDFRFPVADPTGETPLFASAQPDVILLSPDDAFQQVLARLAPGSTPATSSAELSGIFTQEASAYYRAGLIERTRVLATPLQDRLVGDARRRLLLVMAVVGCVLLVVCANIANLMLARLTGRQQEFMIRTALGARTGRLVRMILTETLMIAALGAAGALLLAVAVSGVMRSMLVSRLSHLQEGSLDWRVLAFNAVLAAATGMFIGVASLLAIRARGVTGGIHGRRRSVTGHTALQRTLLAAQVAVVFVLVLTASLLSQTLWNLHHSKRGFDDDRLLTLAVMPGMSGTIPQLQQFTSNFFTRLTDQIARVPGVDAVAAASTVPFAGPGMGMSGVSVIGRPPVAAGGASVSVGVVTPGYFATMRTRLLDGRDFSRLDTAGRERVAVVNETCARALAVGQALVGGSIQFGEARLTVIGVVEDTPDTSLRQAARAFVYVPLAQTIGTHFVYGRLTILVRARTADPATLIPAVREAVWALDRNVVIDEVTTMRERLAGAVRRERDSAMLFGLLASIALVVALAGVYGVAAYSVSMRTREMGIRIALGATSRRIVGGILRESATPLAAGIVAGLAGAIAATRALASALFGIQPTDPRAYAATALVLVLTALAAACIPARRATRVDPVTALRAE
jgi:putative ABC transport system permease protein